MPSGKVAQPAITDNKDGTVTVRYAPSEAGLHEMDIRYDNMHIPGAPPRCTASALGGAWGGGTEPHSTWPLFLPQFPLKASLLTSGESTPRLREP